MKLVKCNDCGHIHFAISRAEVDKQIETFNQYYNTLPEEQKQHFSGPNDLENYLYCDRCGNDYTGFIETDEGPHSSTINPILSRLA